MRIDLATGTITCPRCKRTRTFATIQRLRQWHRVHLRGCTPHADVTPGSQPRPRQSPVKGRRNFTPADDAIMAALQFEAACAAFPDRSRDTIRQHRARLHKRGLMKHPDPSKASRPWTADEDEVVLRHPAADAADLLPHRTPAAIRKRRIRLKQTASQQKAEAA